MKPGSTPRPPRLAEKAFDWFAGNAFIEDLRGDIDEMFYANLKHMSLAHAKWIYWRQTIELVFSYAVKLRKYKSSHHPYSATKVNCAMITSYVRIGLRTILRNKGYAFINIAGLSIGLAACMLIILYVKDEVSYDRFHKQGDNIYQLTCDRIETSGETRKFAIAAMAQGPAFAKEIEDLQIVVRTKSQSTTIKRGHEIFVDNILWVDDDFFSVFSFPLMGGNPKTVFSDIHALVITPDVAEKYFGDEDVIGKSLEIQVDGEFETFVVSGIAKPSPENSTIKFRLILPFKLLEEVHPDNGWHWVSFQTYFLLNPNSNLNDVKSKMDRVYQTQAKGEIDEMKAMGYGDRFVWGLQPFTQMHRNTSYEGVPAASDPIYTYVLLAIAGFILIIACINFINISIAQSMSRTKEIGIRKVIGSQRLQLAVQFLGESFMLCIGAFVLAVGMAWMFLPVFNELANKSLSVSYLFDTNLAAGLLGLLFITSITSGMYPALVLSSFNPVKSLSGKINFAGRNSFTKLLVIFQYSLSVTLIIATLFIHEQFTFLTEKNLGYNDKDLLELTVDKAIRESNVNRMLKSEFSAVPGVEIVAPKNIGNFQRPVKAGGRAFQAAYEHIDEDYVDALQIPIVVGRNFSEEFPADSLQSVMVNETFAREAGWEDPIGKTVDYMDIPDWGDKKLTVVGVVHDYHFESLKEKIKPQVFTYEPKLPWGKFLVRIKSDKVFSTLSGLEDVFRKKYPFDFFQYSYRDDLNRRLYADEAKWKQIVTIAAVLTIFISSMGLYGLTVLSTKGRTREIGIRKVLGASSTAIVSLIAGGFLKLTIIAVVISIPVVWYGIELWLSNFAYRIDITAGTFAAAGVLAISLAFLTICFHVVKAGLSNPVNSLKNE